MKNEGMKVSIGLDGIHADKRFKGSTQFLGILASLVFIILVICGVRAVFADGGIIESILAVIGAILLLAGFSKFSSVFRMVAYVMLAILVICLIIGAMLGSVFGFINGIFDGIGNIVYNFFDIVWPWFELLGYFIIPYSLLIIGLIVLYKKNKSFHDFLFKHKILKTFVITVLLLITIFAVLACWEIVYSSGLRLWPFDLEELEDRIWYITRNW